jgi:hypothetical protein
MIGINVTGDESIQPLLDASSSYINTVNLPSYMILSSIMTEKKEPSTDSIKPVRLSGRLFQTRKNNSNNKTKKNINNRNNNNNRNNSNDNNSNDNNNSNNNKEILVESGHIVSFFESNDEDWFYKATEKRETNFKKVNWTEFLKLEFPHLIYPYYTTRDGNIFICRIHYKYTNKGNKITKLTVYNPETKKERELNRFEYGLLVNGKKTHFISFYNGIGNFLKESNFLKAVYGNTSDNIILRVDFNNTEIQQYVSVNWDVVEEWCERVFHPFIKQTWPIYRKGSTFPDIYDPWKEIA